MKNKKQIMCWRPKNIYEAVYPLYIVSKCCWILPYSFNRATNCYLRSVLFLLADLLVVTVVSLCFLLVSNQNTVDETKNSISNISSWFELYSGTMLHTAGVVMNCFYSKRLVKMFSQLESIDAQLVQLGQWLNYKNTFLFTLVGVFVAFIELSLTFPSDYVFFLTDESGLFIFCSYAPMITCSMIKLQFLTFVYLLEQRYAFINNTLTRLERKIEPIRKDDSKIVQDISKFVLKEDYLKEYVHIIKTTYYKMWKMTVWINRIYGLQLLISIATAFSIMTTQYYLIYESLSKLAANYSSDQVAPIYFAFQWSSIQIFEVLVFVYYCTKTQNEAQVTAKIIHNLQAKVDNNAIIAQLKLFSLHILHQNITFTACQLFAINKITLHSILAAITTYLVVMIQYDLASKNRMAFENNQHNVTYIN